MRKSDPLIVEVCEWCTLPQVIKKSVSLMHRAKSAIVILSVTGVIGLAWYDMMRFPMGGGVV